MRRKIKSLVVIVFFVMTVLGSYGVGAEEESFCICNYRLNEGLVDFKDLYAYKYLKEDEVYMYISSEKEFENKVKKAFEITIRNLQEQGLYIDKLIPRLIDIYVVRQGLRYTDATTTFDDKGKVDIAIYANLTYSSVDHIVYVLTHEIGHLVEKFHFTGNYWDEYIDLKSPGKEMITDKYSDEMYEVEWEYSMTEVFAEDFSYIFRGGDYHKDLVKNKRENLVEELRELIMKRTNGKWNSTSIDLYNYQYIDILNERLDSFTYYCDLSALEENVSKKDKVKLGVKGEVTYKEAGK